MDHVACNTIANDSLYAILRPLQKVKCVKFYLLVVFKKRDHHFSTV